MKWLTIALILAIAFAGCNCADEGNETKENFSTASAYIKPKAWIYFSRLIYFCSHLLLDAKADTIKGKLVNFIFKCLSVLNSKDWKSKINTSLGGLASQLQQDASESPELADAIAATVKKIQLERKKVLSEQYSQEDIQSFAADLASGFDEAWSKN